ncbi:unnamed protein product [Colias eurytheme]|nr:unnamed protein product [Colias eurytheme]
MNHIIVMCGCLLFAICVNSRSIEKSNNINIHPVEKFVEVKNRYKRDFSYEEILNRLQFPDVTSTSYVKKIIGTGPLANNIVMVGFGKDNNNYISFR